MLVNYHSNCRVCNHELTPVLNLGDQCLDGLFVLPTFNPPTRKLPLELCFCTKCKLAQSRYSVDPDILYSSYGYLSSTNTSMTNHLNQIVKDIIDFRNKYFFKRTTFTSLDIGSNDFYLLQQYPKHCMLTGIDPGNYTAPSNIEFINDIYPSKRLDSRTFNVITYIASFYDNNNVVETAQAVSNNLTDGGIAVLEVSYWPEKMRKIAFDEICREHVVFYTYENLEYIFGSIGLKIFRAKKNDINGGSIQIWLCKEQAYSTFANSEYKKEITQIKLEEFNLAVNELSTYKQFEEACGAMKELTTKCLNHIVKTQNKTVHLYGCSTKGNVLLQYLGIDNELILYGAERNLAKWGGYTLGSNIKMVSEEESRAMKPDYYLCLIWGFKNAVIEREQEFIKRGGKFIFPFGESGVEIYPE